MDDRCKRLKKDFPKMAWVDCYQLQLCAHPKVCESWKKAVCTRPEWCVDNDKAVQKASGNMTFSCGAMSDQCYTKGIAETVLAACPKTCGLCSSGQQQAEMNLDDAIAGMHAVGDGWAKNPAPASAWTKSTPAPNPASARPEAGKTPTPTGSPVLQRSQAGFDNMCEF